MHGFPTGCATSCTFGKRSFTGSFNARACDWQGIRKSSAFWKQERQEGCFQARFLMTSSSLRIPWASEGSSMISEIHTNVGAFSDRVQEHLRAGGSSQKELADALGLHPKVLSRKLNGNGNARLTHLEIQRIITQLAHAHVITTREEVLDLLELAQVGPTIFSDEVWQ